MSDIPEQQDNKDDLILAFTPMQLAIILAIVVFVIYRRRQAKD